MVQRENEAIRMVEAGGCHGLRRKMMEYSHRVSRGFPLVRLLVTSFIHRNHPFPPIGSLSFLSVSFVYRLVYQFQ